MDSNLDSLAMGMAEELGIWSVAGVIVISTVVSYLLYEGKRISYKILKK